MIKNELSKTILERLQAYLAERFPGANVTGFQFLTSGYETYSEISIFRMTEVEALLGSANLPGTGNMSKHSSGKDELPKLIAV